ncbi:MAG TPA: hypothetical protein VHZ54_17600 [Solirubrobacterales bacterium]|jgi:hypothetical protein|nr:hypothetical protein [Solirubrobacterales bacterium]
MKAEIERENAERPIPRYEPGKTEPGPYGYRDLRSLGKDDDAKSVCRVEAERQHLADVVGAEAAVDRRAPGVIARP